jgi:hypothetical protein
MLGVTAAASFGLTMKARFAGHHREETEALVLSIAGVTAITEASKTAERKLS